MRYQYVWLLWSSAFLLPRVALQLMNPLLRHMMWRTSTVTAALGLTDPICVPTYLNPPSRLALAQRTGFDVERLFFSFAIGGVGVVLHNAPTRMHPVSIPSGTTHEPPIAALILGSRVSVLCRPRLAKRTLGGGVFILGLYAVFMAGLVWTAPGYPAQVWNLPALSGVHAHYTWSDSVPHSPRPIAT